MFTRFFKRAKNSRVVTEVADATSTVSSTVAGVVRPTSSGNLYAVTLPGQEPVMLRGKNQVEVKARVREAHGFTRLPAGTTVERVD